MSALPYLRWWVADALASTAHMDATETGAYRLLLDHQWLSGSGRLPDDPRKLQRLARVYDGEEWKRVWSAISEKFEEDEGGLYNPRMEQERSEALGRKKVRSAAARKAAAARWGAEGMRDACVAHSKSTQRAYDDDVDVGGDDVDEDEDVGREGGAPAREGSTYPKEFEEWWETYPRKAGKRDARKAWKQTAKERPPVEEVIRVTEMLTETSQWQKDGGEYIPYPATWLRRGGWEDDPAAMNGGGRDSPHDRTDDPDAFAALYEEYGVTYAPGNEPGARDGGGS